MTFFAQHGEDGRIAGLLLERFGIIVQEHQGRYVDVGAWDPDVDSVTKYFYDLGWSGINIEPVKFYHEKLSEARPRDINMGIAISDEPGMKSFTHIVGTGLSTFVDEYREQFSEGRQTETYEVSVRTLAEVLGMFMYPLQSLPSAPIDFLKVDVEGWEGNVLRSNDWTKFRPRVLCIEATVPGTSDATAIPAWETWDQFVIDQGYQFVEYDGLNRYYIDERSPRLRKVA